ncbi:hypothetical protein [Thauera mechernichensis]
MSFMELAVAVFGLPRDSTRGRPRKDVDLAEHRILPSFSLGTAKDRAFEDEEELAEDPLPSSAYQAL